MTEGIAFLAVAAVVICTPGQDTALTIRNAVAGGRRSGVATALGVAIGQAVWTFAASAGIAAVISASQPLYLAIKLAGAAYLVLLGLQSLRAAFARRSAGAAMPAAAPIPPRRALRQGVMSNLGNPKMAAFFTSLLPQFAESFASLVALGLAFSALTFLWLAAYSVAVAKARAYVVRPRVRRALEATMGAVLIALGLRLATSARP